MNIQANDRRNLIEDLLRQSGEPVSAATLARQFDVSRQVIVGDIALLRAAGVDIQATPRGYILVRPQPDGYTGTIACRHTTDEMRSELYTVTDLGGTLIDVIVDHPVYGQLTGQLQIQSRYDADSFMEKLADGKAQMLSQITDGVHLHTIRCPDEAAFRRIVKALAEAGLLYQKQD